MSTFSFSQDPVGEPPAAEGTNSGDRELRDELEALEQKLELIQRYNRRIVEALEESRRELTRLERKLGASDGPSASALGADPGAPAPAMARNPNPPPDSRTTVSSGPKDLVSPANLKLIGGWKLDRHNSTAFIDGGFAIDLKGNRCWTDAGHHNGVIEYALPEMARGTDFGDWPVAPRTKTWKDAEIFPEDRQYFKAEGIAWDGARLWVSGRSTYNTTPDMEYWLASWDGSSWKPHAVNASQQKYGGGITNTPDGRMAFASGGYRSGQRSTLGPSLATWTPESLPSITPLISYARLGQHGKSTVAPRPGDYSHDGTLFGLESMPPNGDNGYWQADTIYGGGCWVETDGLRGVLFMTRQGTGDLRYSRQGETFAAESKIVNRLYAFDPNDYSKPPFIHNWQLPSQLLGKTDSRRLICARGMEYRDGVLYVLLEHAWGGPSEAWPMVLAYRVNE